VREIFCMCLEGKCNEIISRILQERKVLDAELQRCTARNEQFARLYERLYEDNVSGKVTDEWFMQLSYKYEEERLELKTG
jgi:site-specific DNA recombinase